jgi:large subunit ribosomal protein L19
LNDPIGPRTARAQRSRGNVMKLVRELEAKYTKQNLPNFNVGDNVDVEVRIKEGDKERIQLFSGVVIQKRGAGIRTMFTVRRIVQGEGVERVFPLHSPKIANVVVRREGRVRRSKLFYLRGRTGRAARIDEKARTTKSE